MAVYDVELDAYPKMRSGWAMKSVMRSSMDRGSSTKVGNVTLERSMPTLRVCVRYPQRQSPLGIAHLSWEISEVMMEPSCSSLKGLKPVSDTWTIADE